MQCVCFPFASHWRLVGLLASKLVFIRYDGVEYFDCDFPSRFQVALELFLCGDAFAMWSTPVVGDHLAELVNRRVGTVHQLFVVSTKSKPVGQ